MRLFASFILSAFIYITLLFFFILVINQNQSQKPKIVYVHQVITPNKINKPINKIKKIEKKQQTVKKVEKKIEQKVTKTKDNLSKGGEDKLEDIFSNVDDNIPTTPIKHKEKKDLTRKKGDSVASEVKKILKNKLKTNMTVANVTGASKDQAYMQNELSKIWSQIETNINDFVKIKLNVNNGQINVIVIATNLDTIRLNQFLSKINQIDTTKVGNIDAIIEFKAELKD